MYINIPKKTDMYSTELFHKKYIYVKKLTSIECTFPRSTAQCRGVIRRISRASTSAPLLTIKLKDKAEQQVSPTLNSRELKDMTEQGYIFHQKTIFSPIAPFQNYIFSPKQVLYRLGEYKSFPTLEYQILSGFFPLLTFSLFFSLFPLFSPIFPFFSLTFHHPRFVK